jgi:hypothetical protein
MALIIPGQKKASVTPKPATPYYKRQIRCPGHWLVSPKVDVYLREPILGAKYLSDEVEYLGKKIKIRKTKISVDRYGRKRIDWKKLHALRKTGQVIHQPVSASWAIENIWDPLSYLCQTCPKWCREARPVSEFTIKRLHKC